MSKARKDAALKVAQSLFETEAAIDAALAKAAGFVGVMPQARVEANLSAIVGQDAINKAMAALAALTQARQAIVEAHNELAGVQDSIGMQEVAFGSMGEKPSASLSRRDIQRLRLVTAA